MSLIPTLAILKTNFDAGNDYIENFVPLVAECLRTSGQPEVSIPELQASVRDAFGLNIPIGALRTILKRCARQEFVHLDHGVYRRNEERLATLNFAPVRDDVSRQYEALLAKLRAFCQDRYNVTWNAQEAEAAAVKFIEDSSSILLAAAVDGQPILVPPAQRVPHADFLVAAFAAHVCANDFDGFRFLETVVKGSMLAAVLLFPDLGKVERNFSGLEVYFDTPFLLAALGLSGQTKRAACTELLDLLFGHNANLYVFEHTVQETTNVIGADAHALRNPSARTTQGIWFQFVLDSGLSASDLEVMLAEFEQTLTQLHIRVKAKPEHTEELGMDEKSLEAFLQNDVGYQRSDTLHHDLDSVTAIFRLRNGKMFPTIEACRAIFVTTNHHLALSATRFLNEQYEGSGGTVPLCMSDHLLTTIAWLKRPREAVDLPMKMLIANSYAAMNPPTALWRRYLEEIARLAERGSLTQDDVMLLRFSLAARGALMDRTLGDVEGFSTGTIDEVLEVARAHARADTERQLKDEQEARTRDAEEAQKVLDNVKANHYAAEVRVESARSTLAAQRREHVQRVQRYARAIAGAGGFMIQLLGLIVIAGVIFAGAFVADPPGGILLPLFLAVVVPVALLTIANLVVGTTLRSFVQGLEERAYSRIQDWLLERFPAPYSHLESEQAGITGPLIERGNDDIIGDS